MRSRACILLVVCLAGCSGSGGAALDAGPGGAGGRDAAAAPEAACVRSDAQQSAYLDMNVRGEGFDAHEGKTIFLLTTDGGLVLGVGRATITAGQFVFRLAEGYRRRYPQQVLWYVDEDGDGVCNAALGDARGYVMVGPLDPSGADALDVMVADVHATAIPGAGTTCDGATPFGEMSDMNVAATGFADHEGATVRLLTRSGANGAVFGSGQTVVTGGGFSLHLPAAFQQFTYQELFWFLDLDRDGTCTAADHPGFAMTAAARPTGNDPFAISITDNHTAISERGAEVCAVMNGCPIAP